MQPCKNIVKHPTVTVFLMTDRDPRRVLLLQHRKLGKWLPPGGHQENHENPCETAIREVLEETGLDISAYFPPAQKLDARSRSLPLPQFFLEVDIDSNAVEPAHRHLDMVYVVEIPFQPAVHNPLESHSIRWFQEDDLPRLETFDNVRDLIRQIFHSGALPSHCPPPFQVPATGPL